MTCSATRPPENWSTVASCRASKGGAMKPLQRIGAGQAVVAGQRQRVLDDGDRVVGDRKLDDAGFRRAQLGAIVEIAGKALDQARVDRKPRLDAADDLLRPRQGRERC